MGCTDPPKKGGSAHPISVLLESVASYLCYLMLTCTHCNDVTSHSSRYQFLDNAFILASALILSVVAVPWLLLMVPVIVGCFYKIQALYRASARELLRLDGALKSPIFQLFVRC